MGVWRIPRKRRRIFRVRLTIFILLLLGIFIIVFLKPISSTFRSYKKINIEIYNGCSDFCKAVGVEGIAENLIDKIKDNQFNVLQPQDHPIYRVKLKSEIIFPPDKTEEVKGIHILLPSALIREDKKLNNTIRIILGVDSIKSLSSLRSDSRSVVFILDKKNYEDLKPRLSRDFKVLNPVIIRGDESINEFKTINIFSPRDRLTQVKELKRIFGREEIREKIDNNYSHIIVVIPPSYAGAIYRDYSIIVRKSEFKLYLYKGDSLIKTYPVAIGKNPGDKREVGDCRTPEGDFYITSIEDSSSWVHDFGDGKGPIKGAYGPWFLRLYTGADRTKSGKAWEGIGIHGTHNPASIGKMASEGCIRMRNEDIMELRERVKIGTPVKIEP